MRIGRWSSVLAGVLALAAPRAQAVLPEQPFLVVQLDGPGEFAQKFAATNVGSMLAAKEAGKFWDGLGAALRGTSADEPEWLRDSSRAVLEGLRTYGGRITITLALGKRAQKEGDEFGKVHGTLVLAADGKTDLAALAKRLETILQKSGPVRTVKVGDVEHPVVVSEFGAGFTLPRVVDGQLVTWMGAGIEPGLGEWLTGKIALPVDAEAKSSPFALWLDLQQLVAEMKGSWWHEAGKEEKAFAILGLPSLRDLRVLVRPSGPRVMVETSVGFGPEDRGMFEVFLPALAAPPALLALVPQDAREWTASKFRSDRLVEIVLAMMELFDEKATLAADENPFRFIQPDYLQLGNLIATEMGGGMFPNPFGDFTIAVRVKEPAAYAAALPRFMKRTHQVPAELEDVERFQKGTHAQRISIFDMAQLIHAQRDDLVVIGHGEEAEERVARMIAQQPGEPPPDVASRKAQHPPGLHGCGRIDVRGLLTAPPAGFLLAGMPFVFGEMEGEAAEKSAWSQTLEPILPLLDKHELHWAWTFAGYYEGRYRHRVVW